MSEEKKTETLSEKEQARRCISAGVRNLIASKVINGRDDIIRHLSGEGFEIIRVTPDSITLCAPDEPDEALTLDGYFYSAQFSFRTHNKREPVTPPEYDAVRGLAEMVIPDYGLRTDSQKLLRRGNEIKRLFPALDGWPVTTLAEAEMYQEDAGCTDERIRSLALTEFLTLLFNPRCRAEWDQYIDACIHCQWGVN